MPVIAHNMMSQFANRQLNITDNNKSKSSEKLSSGYRINRAADDAAGLAISEKLRWQVRGLNRCSKNIQDGVSICQVADGALNETHEILQRMRELSIQAANDTNSEQDRNAIQREIDQLTEEVDRIANDTSFNKEFYPLLANASETATAGSPWKLPSNIHEKNVFITADSYSTALFVDGKKINPGETAMLTGLYSTNSNSLCIDRASSSNWSGTVTLADIEYYSLTLKDLKMDDNGYVYYESRYVQWGGTRYYLQDDSSGTSCIWDTSIAPTEATIPLIPYVKGTKADFASNGKNNLWIQMGAQQDQGMFLSLVDATAKGVGITDPTIDVTSHRNASEAMSRLGNAIDKVSSYRSNFGTQQNRLEFALKVDDNTAENSQSAESRIRDTDMAEEMVNQSKHSILQQAGQAMLAQANQLPNGVLQLLQ